MKARQNSFVLACLFALECCATASASGPDQFKAFIETTQSARASFSQSVVSKSGRKAQVSQGTFAFLRPGKFRWTYEKPYYQLMVGDGERLWIHDRDLNQVSVKKLGLAIGSSPAALLAGDAAAEKHFAIVDAGASDGLELIEATPRSPDGGFERVRLGFRNNLPQLMEVHDNFGQVTTLRFERFERNPALPPGLFRFVPPKDADVVGE
ncbi:MAG: outer membrane lipoprotein carrier protein LolA [Rhodocyclaceae bacterium]|nr:MAG: outer membrane lipoprotein carrier protein LolA [Rhodocyclaceae bacterium]